MIFETFTAEIRHLRFSIFSSSPASHDGADESA